MTFELEIHGSADPGARYLSYAPSPARIRSTDPTATAGTEVTLESRALRPGGGVAVFYPATGPPDEPEDTLTLTVPPYGQWVDFRLAGKWDHPSVDDRDCEVSVSAGGETRAAIELMVRVRKDAERLEPAERDRFLEAFGVLNDRGLGKFADFRATHVDAAYRQAHGGPQFLPWHRAYLLDLERELQAVDPSVSLHYWRWDAPAPSLFHEDFIGIPGAGGVVHFTPGHPLETWITDGRPGIRRRPHFDTRAEGASFPFRGNRFAPHGQAETLDLGAAYPQFAGMENNPHGWAHVSFEGDISVIDTAARDPLFFMLHANVDRLWALWQWTHGRTRPDDPESYLGQEEDGRRLADTLWPWNEVETPPRPDFAPGGPLADSPTTLAPGPQPTLGALIDLQGTNDPTHRLGYGYDSVPYEHALG